MIFVYKNLLLSEFVNSWNYAFIGSILRLKIASLMNFNENIFLQHIFPETFISIEICFSSYKPCFQVLTEEVSSEEVKSPGNQVYLIFLFWGNVLHSWVG